jgi:hypothetical protein
MREDFFFHCPEKLRFVTSAVFLELKPHLFYNEPSMLNQKMKQENCALISLV